MPDKPHQSPGRTPYTGKVYCVTVPPHHTVMTRHRGRVSWSGQSELQYIAFDELTQFPQHWYEYMFSRLRRVKGNQVPLRVRAASNPGGQHGNWVFKRFVDAKKDKKRVFIPAQVYDNPHLNADEYAETLQELDPVEKARLLHGDWFIQKAGLVYPDFESCVVPPRPLPEGEHFGGIDFGFNNPFAALAGVLDSDDVLWIYWERYKRNVTLQDHARELPRDHEIRWFMDPSAAEPIAQLRKLDFVVNKANNKKEYGITLVTQRIRTGRLKVFNTCAALREEMGLYHRPERPDVADDAVGDPEGAKNTEEPVKLNDHCADAIRYLVAGITRLRGGDEGRRVEETPDRPTEIQPPSEASLPPALEELGEHNWHRLDNPAFWQQG